MAANVPALGTPAPAALGTARAEVLEAAKAFFAGLLGRDARALSTELSYPFQLEGRRLGGPEEFVSEVLKHVRGRRTDLLTLYDVEVLTPAEMEARHGKPPARLGALAWTGAQTYIAIANLSGRPAIALFRPAGRGWQAFAFTD